MYHESIDDYYKERKIMKILFILIFILACSGSFSLLKAESIEKAFKFKSYEKAKQASSFLKFDMKSTKIGIITTSFDGYVKNFKISGRFEKGLVHHGQIEFDVKQMDTDSDGRNEKMYNKCLDFTNKKHSKIVVRLVDAFDISKVSQKLRGILRIRGKNKKIMVDFQLKKDKENYILTGNSDLSIKALDIPDPSIIVASVNDKIKVSFKFILQKRK